MRISPTYAAPREVKSLDDCTFYHTIDLPNDGTVQGMWDLRPNVDKYLGHVDLKGKSVLELGTSSGYLCFHMEKQGANVTSFDIAPDQLSDIVPYARVDTAQRATEMEPWLDRIRNAYWYAHKAFNSEAKMVYGNVYDVPESLGRFDVATYGAILLHLRDPFLALQNGLRLTQDTVIITEPIWTWLNFLRFFAPRPKFGGYALFIPNAQLMEPATTWWHLSPNVLRKFIAVLGFEESTVSYHYQKQPEAGRNVLCFTIVGKRTVPLD